MLALTHYASFMVPFSILAYIAAILVIVFVHELGHFLVGRWSGVKIEAFSIGFGREIWGFNDRHGTRWKLCWIPIGGYVRFEGDANAASMPSEVSNPSPTSLQGAKLWKRFLIVLAGPVANFLFSILIFAAAYMVVGQIINEPRVDEVLADGAGQAAGLQGGDFIRKIDGVEVKSFSAIQDIMMLHGATPMVLDVERSGQPLQLTVTPKVAEIDDGMGSKMRMAQMGIKHDGKLDPQGVVRASLPEALVKGVDRTWFVVKATMNYVGKVLLGAESSSQLHGPAGVAKVAGDTAMMGVWPFVFLIGLISVSIGLVNLFPIPMLDGGHLLFYLIEGLTGRPISPVAQEWSFRIGLSAILMLLVLATTNDASMFYGAFK